MTHLYFGCDKIFGNRKGYFKTLSALEVTETFEDTVTNKRLANWRTESPKGFAFVMTAHRGVTHPAGREGAPALLDGHDLDTIGLLQRTDAVRAAWDRTLEMAGLLSPKLILVRTPLDFSPSQQNRDNLQWFAEELAPMAGKAMVAWEPHGLWEIEEAVPMARQLGLVPVYDPFSDEDLPQGRGTACFAIYSRRGMRATFNEFDMEDLLAQCDPYQRAIVIFRGQRRYRDARMALTANKARVAMDAQYDGEDED